MQPEKDSTGEEHMTHKEKHAHHEPHTHEAPEEMTHESAAEIIAEKKVINVKLAVIIALVVILGAVLYSSRGLLIAATVNGSPVSRMSRQLWLSRRANIKPASSKKPPANFFRWGRTKPSPGRSACWRWPAHPPRSTRPTSAS